MITPDQWLAESRKTVRMIMQMPDELFFEVAEDAVADVQAVVVAQMEAAAELSVPLKVDAGVGKNWDEAD